MATPTENTALAANQNQQVQKQSSGETIRQHLSGDNFKNAVANALPAHIKPERFVRIALTQITKNPKLLECTPETFFRCLLDLSAYGLEPDGRMAHLIPRKNNKNGGKMECTYIIDYKGLVDLARRSGEVSYIHCDCVFEGDQFDYRYGSEAKLIHRPDLQGERKALRAVYSFVKMKDGSEDFIVMGPGQIAAIRKRSASPDSGPWVTDYNEMAKKSCFRNHSKWLPFSSSLKDAIEAGEPSIIEASGFELPEAENTDLLDRVKAGRDSIVGSVPADEGNAKAI